MRIGYFLSLFALSSSSLMAETPNIIIILVDDLGFGDLSCQGQAKDIKTPNIDLLLNKGIRFTNLYANCTVSSPSRAALLTGKYPDLVGVPGVIRTNPNDSWGYLNKDAILLPQLLKNEQYHTAIIGKWHLGLESPNTPTERGFDYFHGFLGDMMDDYYTHKRQGKDLMFENKELVFPIGHATDIFTNWAIRYVNEQKSSPHPFFLYLAYNAPHFPEQAPQEWLERVKEREPEMSSKRAKLVALIEHLDYNIGQLYDELQKNGQLENTVIFFASDNGGNLPSEANNHPYRGGKQDMYDGGIHVPGGVYWENHIQSAVNDNLVMLFDYFTTICELTGAKISHPIDAISITPLLRAEKQITDDRFLVWTRREGGSAYAGRDYFACRYKNLKLVQNRPFNAYEFYNIEEDIQEKKPLQNTNTPEFDTIRRALKQHILKAGQVPWQKK
jgi:arylsulfatase A-like enzyme